MPPSHSSRHIRTPQTNLAHSELLKLATSLGPGLAWLSDDVLEFVKKNKRLYADKEALEEIRHSGKVFVHDESASIDVQDFIALSSFMGAAEKLMKTTLYKTRIAPQPEKQEAITEEKCATESEAVSAASVASDTAVDTNTDSGNETVTQSPHSKLRRRRLRQRKRRKTTHAHTRQDKIMMENVMTETTTIMSPKSSHSTPTNKMPFFITGKMRSPLLRSNTVPSPISYPGPNLLQWAEDPVTKDLVENAYFFSPPANKPPTKKVKLEPTAPIAEHASEMSVKKRQPAHEKASSVPEFKSPSRPSQSRMCPSLTWPPLLPPSRIDYHLMYLYDL